MAPGAASASCVGAFTITGSCTKFWVPGLCRPKAGPPHTNRILEVMIDAEPIPVSSAGTKPAGVATGEITGRKSKAPAACDSPGSHSTKAASAAAGIDAVDRSSGRAGAAQPGSVPRKSGAHAAAGSAGNVPNAGSGRAAAGLSLKGLSLKGQPSSSEADNRGMGADGNPAVGTSASNAVAERSTACWAPSDDDIWNATDGTSGKEQAFLAQRSPVMPCSATAAGTAAVGDHAGQLPALKAGRQPAEAGSTQVEASSSTHAAGAGKQQAAHGGHTPDVAQVCSCGPSTQAHPPFPHSCATLQGVRSSLLLM